MRFWMVSFATLLLTTLSWAAPPEVPPTLKVKPGQVIAITVKTDKKIGITRNFGATDGFFGELVSPPGTRQFMFQAPLPDEKGVYTGKPQYVIGWWTEGELEGVSTTITIDVPAPLPPTPPVPPGPNPPVPPAPDPLKSFRVIFIFESADNLTPAQRAVVYGKVTEDYLNANCTGGNKGFRRRERNAPSESDATFSALWEAIIKYPFTTPCVAIERNGKVEIVPLEANPVAMVETFKKYVGK